MIEQTNKKCYMLWIVNHKGRISHDTTVFTNAAAAITEGERLKEKGIITDYNFSIVNCPEFHAKKELTKLPVRETIQL